MKILVAEDSILYGIMYKCVFERLKDDSIEVKTVRSNKELMEIKEHYDLAFFDWWLSDGEIIESLKKLKKKIKDIYIVSGFADNEKVIKLCINNKFHLMSKPITEKEIINIIQNVVLF